MTLFLALALAFADIASVKAEPNPDKRSDLALENANRALDEARDAYQAGNMQKTDAELEEVRQSVDLSLDSLEKSGQKPRNSKYYKRAEIALRKMLRRLAGFRDEMSIDDRKPLEDVATRVQEVHDRLLSEIMTKKH